MKTPKPMTLGTRMYVTRSEYGFSYPPLNSRSTSRRKLVSAATMIVKPAKLM